MLELNTQNFEQEVLKADGKVLVDFFATWCGPCKMLSPLLEEAAKNHPEVKFAKVNVDSEVQLAMQYKVASIPTVLLFENGEVVDKFVGYRPADALEEFLA